MAETSDGRQVHWTQLPEWENDYLPWTQELRHSSAVVKLFGIAIRDRGILSMGQETCFRPNPNFLKSTVEVKEEPEAETFTLSYQHRETDNSDQDETLSIRNAGLFQIDLARRPDELVVRFGSNDLLKPSPSISGVSPRLLVVEPGLRIFVEDVVARVARHI
jgi:hypothetical protein